MSINTNKCKIISLIRIKKVMFRKNKIKSNKTKQNKKIMNFTEHKSSVDSEPICSICLESICADNDHILFSKSHIGIHQMLLGDTEELVNGDQFGQWSALTKDLILNYYENFSNNEGDNNVWIMTGCNHLFHDQCYSKWNQNNQSCPICRTDFSNRHSSSQYLFGLLPKYCR
jgi:hypothetical protein